jgi:hypothetical protein
MHDSFDNELKTSRKNFHSTTYLLYYDTNIERTLFWYS